MSNNNDDNGRIIPVYLNHDDPGSFDNRHSESLFADALGKTMDERSKKHAALVSNSERIFEARERSIAEKKARDLKKKKKFRDRVSYALVVVTILGMLGGAHLIAGQHFGDDSVSISEEDKNNIDDRISHYYEKANFIMSNNLSTDSFREQRDKEEAIKKYLLEAASVSDFEFRCALLGTAKELKGQRFNSVVNEVLANANSKDGNNYSSLLFSDNTDGLFSRLGYKDFKDYWENERNAIYRLFIEKGLSASEAEVATMFATGEVMFDGASNSNGRGGR